MSNPGMISIVRSLSQTDFNAFAAVSGDNNPIHVDPEFSARTRFGRTVSHGMLLYTVLWGMVQKQYPGARQVNQTLMFPNPTYTDDPHRFCLNELTATDGRLVLSTQVMRVADGTLTLLEDAYRAAEGGDALVIVTEWQEFRTPNFRRLRTALRNPLIVDGRNIYDPSFVKRYGFVYYGVGLGVPV